MDKLKKFFKPNKINVIGPSVVLLLVVISITFPSDSFYLNIFDFLVAILYFPLLILAFFAIFIPDTVARVLGPLFFVLGPLLIWSGWYLIFSSIAHMRQKHG